jgi:hypothetical protein
LSRGSSSFFITTGSGEARHEANIRDGGKTVHVVFKNIGLPAVGVGAGGVTPSYHHPISQLILDVLFKDDVTVILFLGVSFLS